MIQIQIKGMDKLMKKIKSVEGGKYIVPVLKVGGLEAQRMTGEYPPATIANSPDNPSGRWYQRGYGTKWRRKDGSIDGKKTSEDLLGKWYIDPNESDLSVKVWNAATYAQYVHGEKQAKIHEKHGWKKLFETTKENSGEILKSMAVAFEQAWKNG